MLWTCQNLCWYRWPTCCYRTHNTNNSQTCQIVSLTLREDKKPEPSTSDRGALRRWEVRLENVRSFWLLSEFMLHCVHSSLLSSSYTSHIRDGLWLTLFRLGDCGEVVVMVMVSSSQYNYKAARVKSSFQNKQSRSGWCGLTDPCIVCQNHHSPITFVWNTFSLDWLPHCPPVGQLEVHVSQACCIIGQSASCYNWYHQKFPPNPQHIWNWAPALRERVFNLGCQGQL